ncbi:MAG: FeoC-like transcriptional regulator [Chromatiaceae bacterium]|nr:FeoC-like transcriptional regulator [Chromatiaceae bacterium]MCP5408576.1 FeoC-like transcriptional regulator [Chromatiaceae bacterium]MCP5442540.1 FeoC-like transcriptional regulator [Chromatiaceae bacterium]
MILAEIKRYLQQRGQATLADIALHFDTAPDAVRGMLETLLRKGRIRRQQLNSACGSSCCKCDTAATELYEWTGNAVPDPHETGTLQ